MFTHVIMQVISAFEHFKALSALVLPDVVMIPLDVGLETVFTAEDLPAAWERTDVLHLLPLQSGLRTNTGVTTT
jgi:hypothetical protein